MKRRREPQAYFDLVFKLGTPLALAFGVPAAFYAAKSESFLFDELFVLVASGWGYALAALVAEWREKGR
jgi:predicted outer membrane lipoprotein